MRKDTNQPVKSKVSRQLRNYRKWAWYNTVLLKEDLRCKACSMQSRHHGSHQRQYQARSWQSQGMFWVNKKKEEGIAES